MWATRLVVTGLGIALCLIPISKIYRRAVLRPALPRGLVPGFWRFAIVVGFAGVIGRLVTSRSEIFLMNWLATPAALGVFALAYGLANHVFAPAQAFVGPLVPAIAGLREVDAASVPAAFRRVLRAGATLVGLINAAVVVPLALLVPVLYGDEFAKARPSSWRWRSRGPSPSWRAGHCLRVGPAVGGELLRASVIALIADVVLAVALIPVLGVWGAVIANVTGALLSLAILAHWELRVLGISWGPRCGTPRDLGGVAHRYRCSSLLVPSYPGAPGPSLSWRPSSGGSSYVAALRLFGIGLNGADNAAISRALPPRLTRYARCPSSRSWGARAPPTLVPDETPR